MKEVVRRFYKMKKILSAFFAFLLAFTFVTPSFAENSQKNEAENTMLVKPDFEVEAKSAVLMDASSGEILFEQNADAAYSPASVTKIMTLLLVMEAVDEGRIALSDKVLISAYAASMGGSQVFLREGEELSVEELIKCAVIASANDASVALAELVAGSEAAFVSMMNKRADELSMNNTNFENVTGLDDDTVDHKTSSRDIAIMSRALISHEKILDYTSIWQDSIRNGEFTLTNTNRLVRFYEGCNGLKTGSTSKAGYCMSATAKRGGMQLIAVVMGAESRDTRNSIARTLLDFGFSTYALYSAEERMLERAPVHFGASESIELYSTPFSKIINKSDVSKVELKYTIPESLKAPIKAGDTVGKVEYFVGDELLGESQIIVKADISRLGFFDLLLRMMLRILGG